MRRFALASLLTMVSPIGQAQVTIVAPGAGPVGPATRQSDANYGPPRVVTLDDILLMPESYQRVHVITEGEISAFQTGQYWTLRQGGATVLIIPGREVDTSDFGLMSGKRMEIRGIVRMIRPKQYVGNPPTDLDLLEDPILPPMPPPQGMPRTSITVFAIRDRTNPETARKQETGGGISRQILDEPSAYSGKNTKILGQFRGRNLFADLPANSARGKDDWVLKDGDTAIWVTGKAPKGDGWKLDLDYKGDAKTWLEVEGKPEVVNGVVYLRASRVLPSKASGTERRAPPPR